MKCRECNCCEKGWFKSKPDSYVCIGVKEPFIIENINVECTEYEYKRNKIEIDLDRLKRMINSLPDNGKILIEVTRNYSDMTRKSNEELIGFRKMGKALILQCETNM